MSRIRHLAICAFIIMLVFGAAAAPACAPAQAAPPVAPPVPGAAIPSEPVVIRLYTDTAAEMAGATGGLDVWEEHAEGTYVVARVTPEQYGELVRRGYRVEIDAARSREYNTPRRLLPGQMEGIPGFLCYRTVEETFASAQALVAAHPGLAQWIDVGDSWEKVSPGGAAGYDMQVLRITNSAILGPKPRAVIMGGIHAREYVGPEMATRFAERLLREYGTDPDITGLVDFYEIHLLLHTNPDGRKKAEAGVDWRKNTDSDDGCARSSAWGVDLNRNFTFMWASPYDGSSGEPCVDVYRGPSAGSEPETVAIESYVRSLFPDQRAPDLNAAAPLTSTGVFVDLHSYGRAVMWSWGFVGDAAPNSQGLQTLGRKWAYFNHYDPHQSYTLYATDGTTKDFAYGELGVAAYTIEIGDTFFQDCTSFENTIVPGNMPVLEYAVKASRRPYQTPSGPDSLGVMVSPASTMGAGQATLAATANDTRYYWINGAAEPTQNIAAARYTVDAPSWIDGVTAYPMWAADGSFDNAVEGLVANVDTTGWTMGRHTVFVESQDAYGTWGAPSAVFLTVSGTHSAYLPLLVQELPGDFNAYARAEHAAGPFEVSAYHPR